MSQRAFSCACGCSHSDEDEHEHSHEHEHEHNHEHEHEHNHEHDHGHDHTHSHDHGDSDSGKSEMWMLIACAVFFFAVMALEGPLENIFGAVVVGFLYAIPYLICGIPILKEAWALMRKGNIFNEFTLMCGATIAAICLNQLAEAVGVMLFYRIGEYVQDRAAGKSRSSIKSLLASKPVTAHVLDGDKEIATKVEDVKVGQQVLIRAGEKIPLDGIVQHGLSDVDQSPLTGESIPVAVKEGSPVLGGSINISGVLTVSVTNAFADTHMARILDMIEHAAKRKSPTERFISRFARYYTPTVVALAFFVAVLPPLFSAEATFSTWIYRALVLLVISCPCALLISIPLGYFGGIGAASRRGILVKGGNVLDDILHVDTVVFDKTGTLTKGRFSVAEVFPTYGTTDEDLLRAAITTEHGASHPIAKAIAEHGMAKGHEELIRTLTRGSSLGEHTSKELPGRGMDVMYDGARFLAGNADLMKEQGIIVSATEKPGAVVHVAKNDSYLGHILVADEVKEETVQALSELHKLGLKTMMLTGDREESAAFVANKVGIGGYKAGLLPEGKVEAMEKYAHTESTAFVGDGINDAPILAMSRVGIAMGSIGSEAAIEAADAVILNDSLENVVKLFDIAKYVRSVVWQNIVLALSIKTLFMGFGIVGLSGLWEAIFADVGVALLAVLNSSRIARK